MGAEIPGLLLVYFAPIVLLALSYYFIFHLQHLHEFAETNQSLYRTFAWLPLSGRSIWLFEGVLTVGALPAGSIAVLMAQLLRLGFLSRWQGVFIGFAMVALIGFGLVSLRCLRSLRTLTRKDTSGSAANQI